MKELEIGKCYKLTEICEALGIERKQGGKQLKNMKSKISHYYIIEKVENKSLYKIISAVKEEEKEPHFKVDENLKHNSGVYIIQDRNTVYIGQTSDFYKRYYMHKIGHKYNGYNNQVTNYMILNGADFSILELEENKTKRLELEKYYIINYIKQGYNVLNIRKTREEEKRKKVKTPPIQKAPKIKVKKIKYKQIRIDIDKYDEIIKYMDDNNISYKEYKSL